jgi:glycosyltransferase involved in cell wall biosynthesis
VLAGLYELAHAFVYVPLAEGFGLPVVEAMRAGLAVVASPVPAGLDATRSVDPRNADSIAEGIAEVASNQEIRRALVAKGRARSAPLTWSATASAHLELWRTLAEGRR